MQVAELLSQLKRQLGKSIKELVDEMDYPDGHETGLRNVHNGLRVLLASDGTLEVGAGQQSVLTLSEQGGASTLKGDSVALEGREVSIHGDLMLNWQHLNDDWLSGPFDVDWWWRKAPLRLRHQEALSMHQVVAGTPQPGQYNFQLSDLMEPVPLFDRNRQYEIIMEHAKDVMDSIASFD